VKPRDEAKARDILAATLREIEAVGLAGLGMEAVARRAKVATGTVYIYFKNKAALVNALYLATKEELSSLVFRDEGLPLRATFSRMCVGFLEYTIDHQAEMVFMAQMANSPYLTPKTRLAAAVFGVRPIEELLERGKRELLLKDLDTDLMLAFLYGTLRELAGTIAQKPRKGRGRRLEEVAALCWDALKA
jgi:AcrR family transcriptional regulator